MKVHAHTKFCLICLLTFVLHHCGRCHGKHERCPEEEEQRRHHHHPPPRGAAEPEPGNFSVEAARMKFYVGKLFERYGEDGRLSFLGLERLLTNLGLGEIKVVEIGHDHLGHDHLSHLDLLAVQEGRHLHAHGHPLPRGRLGSGSENQTERSRRCDPEKEKEAAEDRRDRDRDREHSRHACRRHCPQQRPDHAAARHSRDGDAAAPGGHGQGQGQGQPGGRPAKRSRKDERRRKGGEGAADPAGGPPEHEQAKRHRHNGVHKAERAHGHAHAHAHAQDLAPGSQGSEDRPRSARKREAAHGERRGHGEDGPRPECLNATQLLKHYGHCSNAPISPLLFTHLCPALLYQIDNRLCIEHFDRLLVEDLNKEKSLVSDDKANIGASAWICGIISITVISLLSLLGVILVPIINQGCFQFLLTFLVALAVGTMSGDALLHLLPHSQGGHDHSHQHAHGQEHSHGHESKKFLEEYDAVLKGLVALGGIYLLFIIEHCIRMFKHYKQQRGKQKWFAKQSAEEPTIGRKLSDHKLNNTPDADWLQLKPLAGTDDSVISEDRLNETELTDLEAQHESPLKNYLCVDEEKVAHRAQGDGPQNHLEPGRPAPSKQGPQRYLKHARHSHGPCHSGSDLKETGIANIAWMVIMGDGIHNFSDGLAIGAAFSAGPTGGISTSIAVFCHELPHELGDFAVLLKAGMTVKQAIVYNLLSAMMAYVGMLIGTAVGQYANNITLWIFAVTAGMFLYVALVDMLPEMLHGDGDSEEHGFCPLGQFVLQNLGLLSGFAIMLVIALYEDKIVFDIQF